MAYLTATGDVIDREAVAIAKARALADLLAQGVPYSTLIECRRASGTTAETVVFDVEVERGQEPIWPIQHQERIAVIFTDDDGWYPQVLALRDDFPAVPHLNVHNEEFPRSLCLYAETWDEAKLSWTPIRFVERIRWWLKMTAAGELHPDDQPLEPFLLCTGASVILPPDLFSASGDANADRIEVLRTGKHTFQAWHSNDPLKPPNSTQYLALAIRCEPQPHGLIRLTPRNLKQVHDLVHSGHPDLLSTLSARLKSLEDGPILKLPLMLVVYMPKQRQPSGPTEVTDIWAFHLDGTVLEIGANIGGWYIDGEKRGMLMKKDHTKDGTGIRVEVLRPFYALNRETAAIFNGLDRGDSRNAVAVGLGALGSEVVMNLVRTGFGRWTLIDDDTLLPHNTARHVLGGEFVGMSKAGAIAMRIHRLVNDANSAHPLAVNVLRPGVDGVQLKKAFKDASLILDMAATIPVARHLANDIDSSARRLSLFLNPRGTDLVLLAEDTSRRVPLDTLEMQYYRAVANQPDLKDHLQASGERLRYGRSCRDMSSRIAQDMVAQHAAVASRATRQLASSDAARIAIWQIGAVDSCVCCVEIPISRVLVASIADWVLKVDAGLLRRLRRLRHAKLPNETGGVLIGSFDMERKIAYVVDTIPSPPDSEEWPTYYIRGSRTLKARLRSIESLTAGNLTYVGEWHSHPDGYGCLASNDDLKVFGWLTDLMGRDGLPAMMAIVGERQQMAWHIGQVVEPQEFRLY